MDPLINCPPTKHLSGSGTLYSLIQVLLTKQIHSLKHTCTFMSKLFCCLFLSCFCQKLYLDRGGALRSAQIRKMVLEAELNIIPSAFLQTLVLEDFVGRQRYKSSLYSINSHYICTPMHVLVFIMKRTRTSAYTGNRCLNLTCDEYFCIIYMLSILDFNRRIYSRLLEFTE